MSTVKSNRLATIFGRQPVGILLSAPYAVFIAAMFAYPLGLAVWISFREYVFTAPGVSVPRPFVGFDNYATVLGDPDVRRSFVNGLLLDSHGGDIGRALRPSRHRNGSSRVNSSGLAPDRARFRPVGSPRAHTV